MKSVTCPTKNSEACHFCRKVHFVRSYPTVKFETARLIFNNIFGHRNDSLKIPKVGLYFGLFQILWCRLISLLAQNLAHHLFIHYAWKFKHLSLKGSDWRYWRDKNYKFSYKISLSWKRNKYIYIYSKPCLLPYANN